ncbi:MAG: hypothetical protein JNM59_10185 [Hyphomonadaceae bacterium]|nr:hypothetical protein [Hyphomonadaceae bacterium]
MSDPHPPQNPMKPPKRERLIPDHDKIDDAVLALLLLGEHDYQRVWKSFDWDALDRLHAKGLISEPRSKAKSVVLTDEGRAEAVRLFKLMFAKS